MIITKETIEKLKENNIHLETEISLFDNDLDCDVMKSIDKATTIYLSPEKWNGEYFSKTLKAPKKKEVTVEWIMNKLNADSIYVNISRYLAKIFSSQGINCYPTSYGVGVDTLFHVNQKTRDMVAQKLNELGLKFRNEYSSAHWVYRFVISKDAENMRIMQSL